MWTSDVNGKTAGLCAAILVSAAALFVPAIPAAGSGMESHGGGARGCAMGYAMVAVADDWTAVHYNPAGITQIEGQLLGFEYDLFGGAMTSTESLRNLNVGANPMRGDFVDPIGDEPTSFDEDTIAAAIHSGALGYVANWGKLAFGVGLYGSGSGTGWDDTIQTGGGDTIEAEIAFTNAAVNMPIVLAYEASPGLSLGLCIGVRYGMLIVDNNKYRSGAIPYTMATSQDTVGIGVGADLGMLWKANDELAVGAVFKFPYTISKSGETTTDQSLLPLTASSDTTVEESYPARVAVGCAYRPDDRSLLAFSMTWLNWSDYNQKIEYETEIPGIFENWSGNPGNWHDTMVFNLGYERKIDDRWTFRCGLAHDEAPEPREARTLVGGQVVDSWKFAVGAGVEWERTVLNFGYTHTYGPEVDGYIPDAKYSMSLHDLYIGVERRF